MHQLLGAQMQRSAQASNLTLSNCDFLSGSRCGSSISGSGSGGGSAVKDTAATESARTTAAVSSALDARRDAATDSALGARSSDASHPRLLKLVSAEIDALARAMGFSERRIATRDFRAERDGSRIVRIIAD